MRFYRGTEEYNKTWAAGKRMLDDPTTEVLYVDDHGCVLRLGVNQITATFEWIEYEYIP
jgi:hypothetical protein